MRSRWMAGLVAALLAAASLSVPARAASVVNEDKTPYVVLVTTDRGTREINLRPGQTVRDLCESCEVSIEDIGLLTVGKGDKVVIRANTMMVEDE
jgi:uncharacterized protein YdbL (DUF1318 family)